MAAAKIPSPYLEKQSPARKRVLAILPKVIPLIFSVRASREQFLQRPGAIQILETAA